MSLELEHGALARASASLLPYARRLLAESGRYARFLHADEVSAEHLLCTLMADPDCAAHRVVLHAFADPESISEEARATASGILVVGSRCSLPFSALGVEALFAARALAAARGAHDVGLAHLLLESAARTPPAVRPAFGAAFARAAVEAALPAGEALPEAGEAAEAAGEPLFKRFSEDSKRALSQAARGAQAAGQPAISPAWMVLACLQRDATLAERAGLTYPRARALLGEHTADLEPLSARALPPDAGLVAFLEGLPQGANSLELLARCLGPATPELAQICARNKLTPALLERCRGVFRDPEES